MIETAPSLGISVLTLYAFSADNWRRPPREISALMRLLGRYLNQETGRCIANGVRLEAIGRRDRLPKDLVSLLCGDRAGKHRTAAGWAAAPGDRLFFAGMRLFKLLKSRGRARRPKKGSRRRSDRMSM